MTGHKNSLPKALQKPPKTNKYTSSGDFGQLDKNGGILLSGPFTLTNFGPIKIVL